MSTISTCRARALCSVRCSTTKTGCILGMKRPKMVSSSRRLPAWGSEGARRPDGIATGQEPSQASPMQLVSALTTEQAFYPGTYNTSKAPSVNAVSRDSREYFDPGQGQQYAEGPAQSLYQPQHYLPPGQEPSFQGSFHPPYAQPGYPQ